MTNEELFADLKQFIEATVSQQTAHLDERIDRVEQRMGNVEQRIDGVEQRIDGVEQRIDGVEQRLSSQIGLLDEKLDTIQDGIADTITNTTEDFDVVIRDHEKRLRKLERQPA